MAGWLLDEAPTTGPPVEADVGRKRLVRSRKSYSIMLRRIHVLDNKKFFGNADIYAGITVVDGFSDMKDRNPFWQTKLFLGSVKDDQVISYDSGGEKGVLVYKGKPGEFLDFSITFSKDETATRRFAEILKAHLGEKGIGTVLGPAISIFTGQVVGDVAWGAVREAGDIALDYVSKEKKDTIAGIYRGTLLKEDGYGLGFHPPDYLGSDPNPRMLSIGGDAIRIAYEVRV